MSGYINTRAYSIKDMPAIFQEKGKKMSKMGKKGKIFENLGKNV